MKANKPWWGFFIPFYNSYVYFVVRKDYEDEFDDEIDIDNEENTEDLEPFDEALWDKEFGEEQDS